MARAAAGQLSFSFEEPPPAPIDNTPQWFKIELDRKGWSYGHIGICRNEDGTWAQTTRDSFGGYCGHGGPFYGRHESFEAALSVALGRLYKGWRSISTRMNDSCCNEKHRQMARRGLLWLDELAAEYQVAA